MGYYSFFIAALVTIALVLFALRFYPPLRRHRYTPRRESGETYVIRDNITGKDLVGYMALGTAQEMCVALNRLHEEPTAPQEATITCPDCHGTKLCKPIVLPFVGVVKQEPFPCGLCNGVGMVSPMWYEIWSTTHG